MITDKLTALLEEKFKEEEFQDCFLIEIVSPPNKKVEVFVDSDSGITFEKCRKLSRYLEESIDGEGWLGEKYTLEVSSPGIGRPLKFVRQYQKNIGRKLEVKVHEGETKIGILTVVTEDTITIEYKERIKEGKKKKTVIQQDEIPFENIREAKVKIMF